MTGKSSAEHAALNRLTDALVEDILDSSDEEILAEFKETEGDPVRYASDMLARFEKNLIATNKNKLYAAKDGVSSYNLSIRPPEQPKEINNLRGKLRSILDNPSISENLTLAARKESELSDADILSMLDDLRALGILPPEEDEDDSA